ncbi:MAG: CynX/NimT family MFS transporter [Methanomassiliicoccales archaeon]
MPRMKLHFSIRVQYMGVMLFLAIGIAFLMTFLLYSTSPMVNRIMGSLSLSNAEFGMISTGVLMTMVALRIPWGIAGDRYGYMTVLKISLPLIAAAALLRGFAQDFPALMASQLLLGAGVASILPCLPMIVREWAPHRTGFATGLYTTGYAVGTGVALGLTPLLLEGNDWRYVLVMYSLVAMFVAVLWWSMARSLNAGQYDPKPGEFWLLLKDKYVWALAIFMIATGGCWDTLTIWMPKVLEMKAMETSLALILALGFISSGPLVGPLSDRVRDEGVLLGALGMGVSLSLLGIALASGPLALISVFLAGFFISGTLVLILRLPAKDERLSYSGGQVVAIFSSVGNLGSIFMPMLFGYMIDLSGGYLHSFYAVTLIAFLIFFAGSCFWVGTKAVEDVVAHPLRSLAGALRRTGERRH